MSKEELKRLLKRVVELAMPDLRSYYRVVKKARVEKTYASDGQYYADVQPLRNDNSVDEKEPVIKMVEIPVIWGGPDRGVICPPAAGVYCDLEYYDGDPNYPRISNFRWLNQGAPACGIGEFIIQQGAGVFVKIDAAANVTVKTTGDITLDRGAQKIVLDDSGISIDGGSGLLDGVITGKCLCKLDGLPISDKSADVKASK
ncbi:MAG: baseplate assembly protein [Deltaproteobacteria bacterium]|nr:baseplate assembly protein [Deltaproteobacteria bacterium]